MPREGGKASKEVGRKQVKEGGPFKPLEGSWEDRKKRPANDSRSIDNFSYIDNID